MSDIQRRKKKNGEYSYTARVRIKGFPSQTMTFSKLTLAKEWIKKTETQLQQGLINPAYNAQQRTIKEIIEQWEMNELPKRKPKAQEEFKMILAWFNNEIGAYSLAGITTEILVKCRDKLAQKKKQIPMRNGKIKVTNDTLAPSTVNKYLTYMGVVFEYCVSDLDILQVNPMSKVRKLSVKNERKRYLQPKEIANLLEKCKQVNFELYLCVLIALLTGARKSEVLNLTWNDIDFEYTQSNDNKGMIKFLETKNGDDKFIPIHPYLYNELLNYKQKAIVRQLKNDYIFKNEEGKPKESLIGKLFPKVVKQCDIDDFRFHDLRHTHASWEAMGGVPQQMTQKLLGHRTSQMTNRYSHMRADSLRPYVNNTGDVLLKEFIKTSTG